VRRREHHLQGGNEGTLAHKLFLHQQHIKKEKKKMAFFGRTPP
jgi:hypothetical protein